jgi:di/tripeptidase
MGPALEAYPELMQWADDAAVAMGIDTRKGPIRGGTGVDPFLDRGIPIANLGTGYFAPESEKELTSRQNIARHGLWLTNLVQVVATSDG